MPWGLKRFQETGHSHFVTFSCYHRRPLFTADPAKRVFEAALERVRRSFRLYVYGYVVMPEHVHLLVSEPERGELADALKSLKQGVSRRLISGAPFKPAVGLSGDHPEGRLIASAPSKPAVGLSGDHPERRPIAGAPFKPAVGLSGDHPERRLTAGAPFKPAVGLSGDLPEHFWQKRYYDFNVRNYRQFVEKLRYIHRNPVKRGLCERPEDWEWSSFRQYATGCEGRVEIECEWTARRRERTAGKLCPAVGLPHSSQKTA
jgi:REP element-mobilizing transposase RayT